MFKLHYCTPLSVYRTVCILNINSQSTTVPIHSTNCPYKSSTCTYLYAKCTFSYSYCTRLETRCTLPFINYTFQYIYSPLPYSSGMNNWGTVLHQSGCPWHWTALKKLTTGSISSHLWCVPSRDLIGCSKTLPIKLFKLHEQASHNENICRPITRVQLSRTPQTTVQWTTLSLTVAYCTACTVRCAKRTKKCDTLSVHLDTWAMHFVPCSGPYNTELINLGSTLSVHSRTIIVWHTPSTV